MNDSHSLDEHLLQHLPLPLVQLCRRSQNAKTPLEQHLTAYYLWEASLKLLGATAVVAYAERPQHDSAISDQLTNLARPSIGHWWQFVRCLVPVLAKDGDAGFVAVRDLLLGPARDDLPRAAGLQAALVEAIEGRSGARMTVRLAELFDQLVHYRNREIGHGAAGQKPAEYHQRMGKALLAGVLQLLGRLDVLAGRRLVYVGDVRRLASGGWLVDRYALMSDTARRLEPLQLTATETARLPRPEHVYLEEQGTTTTAALRSLHPLVHYDPESSKVYFLNAQRGKKQIEYLCYSSGDVHSRAADGQAEYELLARLLGRPVDAAVYDACAAHSFADDGSTPGVAEPTGERRLGEFTLLSRLGQGGMGVVYRAWQPSLGRQVALKCMLRSGDPKAEARFAREIRALGRVEHTGVVKVYTSGADGDQWFYAMELIEGAELSRVCHHLTGSSAADVDESRWQQALSTACEQARSQETPLSKDASTPAVSATSEPAPSPGAPAGGAGYVRQVVGILRRVADAVHALHEAGVVHRDVKPGNILLTASDGDPVLVDLGLAQLADETDGRLTRTRQFVGTLRYASPEQVLAAGRVDRRTDVYSLGATLWELLTLRPLFGADDAMPTPDLMLRIQTAEPEGVRKYNRHVPRDLEAIVLKCLEKDRTRRYPTAADLAQDLDRFLSGEPVLAQPPSLSYLTSKFVRRHRAALATTAAVLVLFLVGTVAAFVQITADRNRARSEEAKARLALEASEESRKLAEQRFAEKRKAVDDMLANFSDERLKGLPGTQPIRQVLFERGVALYERMLQERQDDPAVRASLAQRYLELGTLQAEIGTAEESLAPLQKALELQRQLAAAEPDNPQHAAALGSVLFQIGQCYWERRTPEPARPLLEESSRILTALVERSPDNLRHQALLGRTLNRLASVLPGEQAKEAEQFYAKARELLTQVVQREPDDVQALADLARATGNGGSLLLERGEHAAALQQFQEQQRLAETVLKIEPGSPGAHWIRTNAIQSQALALDRMGRTDQGVDLLKQAVASGRAFVGRHPAVLLGHASLADAFRLLARFSQRARRWDEAIEAWNDAIRLWEGLAQRDPRNTSYPRARLDALQVLYHIEQARKRRLNAAAALDRALASADEVMQSHPQAAHLLTVLLTLFYQRAQLEVEAEQPREGIRFSQDGVAFFAKHAHVPDAGLDAARVRAVECGKLGAELYRSLKEGPAAMRLAEQARVIGEPLRAPADRVTWIELHELLALGYEEAGEPDKAIALWVRTREEALRLIERAAWHFDARRCLMKSYERLARLYRRAGGLEEELKASRALLQQWNYVHGKDYAPLLAATAVVSDESARKLRAVLDAPPEIKRYTASVELPGGWKVLPLYIPEAFQPVEDQMRWVREGLNGTFPEDLATLLRRIRQVAQEHKASFQVCCVEALDVEAADDVSRETIRSLVTEIGRLQQELARAADKAKAVGRRRLAEAHLRLAQVHAEGKAHDAASRAVEGALALIDRDAQGHPLDADDRDVFTRARLVQGQLDIELGRYERAYSTLLEAIGLERERSVTLDGPIAPCERALGEVCRKRGRRVEAASWFWNAAELGSAEAVDGVAELYLEDDRTAAVLPRPFAELLRRAREQASKEERPAGFAMRMANLWKEYRIDNLSTGSPATVADRARLLMRIRAYQQAEAQFKEAVRTSPDNPRLLAELASCQGELGRWGDAVESYRRSLTIDPESAEATLTTLNYLKALLLAGQLKEASAFGNQLDQRAWKPKGSAGREQACEYIYWATRALVALATEQDYQPALDRVRKAVVPSRDPALRFWDWSKLETWAWGLKVSPEQRKKLSQVSAELGLLPPTDVVPPVIDNKSRIIVLMHGTLKSGKPFWIYVAVKPSQYRRYLLAQSAGKIDLTQFEEYGELIVSAEGQDPPEEVTNKVAALYNADPKTFFQPIRRPAFPTVVPMATDSKEPPKK